MIIVLISDDPAGARRFADALDDDHTLHETVSAPEHLGELPHDAVFVLIAASPITLRLWVAKLRRRFGPGPAVIVAIGRGEARELSHVLAAGADDFIVWPREPEFLSLRLELIARRLAASPPPSPSPPPPVARAQPAPTDASGHSSNPTSQALLRAIPDLVFWLSHDGAFREFHANDPSLLPAAPPLILNRTIAQVFEAPVASKLERALAAIAGGAPEVTLSYTLGTAERGPMTWEATLAPISRQEVLMVARPERAAGDDHDEQAVGDSRRFLARLVATVPLTVFVYSLEANRFTYLNRPLETLFGLSIGEALDTPIARFAEVIHPDDLPAILSQIARLDLLQDGAIETRRFRVRRADNLWHAVVSRETVFRRDALGAPLEILGVLEEDEATAAAPAAEAARPGAPTSAPGEPIAAALAGPDDHLYGWDFGTGAMTSWGESRFTGIAQTRTEWEARIHESDRPVIAAAIERHLETGAPYSETFRIKLWNGSWRTCIDRGAALRDATGRAVRWVGVCTDITDRVLHHDRLSAEQKLEAVSHLAGGVAQDFNRLLFEVFSNLDRALSSLPAASPLRHELSGARQAAEQAATLTRQLLAFGRRQVLQPEYISINDVIGDMIDTLARRLGSEIELSFESSEHLGTVLADPIQMEQILLTLCSRARDTMPKGGHVAVVTSNVRARDEWELLPAKARDGRYVKLRVEDEGEGFPAELLAHVFDPFYAAADGGPRTGLELAMVHGIVDQHEGVITAENISGGGAALNLYLPIVERPPARLRRPQTPARGGDETLLLVDDDELVRNMAARMLRGAGYNVVTAADGAEGLTVLREHLHAVKLVVLDVVMPRMGGRATYEHMIEILPDMRFIFISGYTMTAQDTDFVQHGGRHFLPKPFNSGQLLREVRTALDD